MLHIRRLQIVFTIVCIGLSACATAIPISTTTSVPTETLTPTASPPTETSTPSPTPEPTATEAPEIIPSKPTEITFDLTNGETISLPAFIANFPENATPEERADIEKRLLEKVLQYFVDKGVDWGNKAYATSGNNVSKDDLEFARNLLLIPGREFVGGYPVRPVGVDFDEFFGLLIAKVPYKDADGSILYAKSSDDEFPFHRVFVGIDPYTIANLIMNQQIDIPRKPITP